MIFLNIKIELGFIDYLTFDTAYKSSKYYNAVIIPFFKKLNDKGLIDRCYSHDEYREKFAEYFINKVDNAIEKSNIDINKYKDKELILSFMNNKLYII